jgi:hypothetical protein
VRWPDRADAANLAFSLFIVRSFLHQLIRTTWILPAPTEVNLKYTAAEKSLN